MREIRNVVGALVVSAVLAGMLGAPAARGEVIVKGKLKEEPKSPFIKNINPEAEPKPGGGQYPEATLEIIAADLVVADSVPFGLIVRKGILGSDQAYGSGLPNGYTSPPPNNPAGPWQGLMWPFRDFNDGYASGSGAGFPPGNDVGTVDTSLAGSGIYRVLGMVGAMNYDPMIPSTYQRGVGGNGADIPTDFFKIEIEAVDMTPRWVTVTLRNLTARVLVRNETGGLETQVVSADDVSIQVSIPSPTTGAAFGLLGLAAAQRRRR